MVTIAVSNRLAADWEADFDMADERVTGRLPNCLPESGKFADEHTAGQLNRHPAPTTQASLWWRGRDGVTPSHCLSSRIRVFHFSI
jgi:hypothetical protein